MVQIDRKIEFQIDSLRSNLNRLKTSIYLYNIAEFIMCIFAVFISGIIGKYFVDLGQSTIGLIVVIFFYIFCSHYGHFLNKEIQNKENEKSQVSYDLEELISFSAYVTAYRHIEALKEGKNIYPELIPSDSEWIIKEYETYFEKARINYEKNNIIDLKQS